MQINSTKWEINKTDCRLPIAFAFVVFVLFVFWYFFWFSWGFYVLPVLFVVAFWEFLFENDDRKAVTFVMCTHWQECPNGHWGTSISTF